MQGVGGSFISHAPSHAPATSEELIEIYRRGGRPEDFEQIVRRFAALVLSECRRITHNAHDAEDASQLVFLALAIEIKSGAPIRRLSPWLQRVARRQALKIVRSHSRRRRREDAVRRPEIETANADAPLDAAVCAGIVRDAIDELPEHYRLPVILYYFGGLSLARIAEELKVKRPAVATRLHRGRKMLEARLAQRGVRLQNGTLAMLLALLVPTGVVRAIVASTGGLRTSADAGAATVVGGVLRTLAAAGARRLLVVVTVATSLACCGTGMAWAIRAPMAQLRRLLHIDPQLWFKEILPTQLPSLQAIKPQKAPFDRAQGRQAIVSIDAQPDHRAMAVLPIVIPTTVSGSSPMSPPPKMPMLASAALATANFDAAPIAPKIPASSTAADLRFRAPTFASSDMQALGTIVLAAKPGEENSLSLAPGIYRADRIDVGFAGDAKLIIGCDVQLSLGEFRVGVEPGSSGKVVQDGGHVTVDHLAVADGGFGDYELKDGRLEAGSLAIGSQAGADGTVNVDGGEILLTNPAGSFVVGGGGSGRLYLGDAQSPGAILSTGAAAPPFIIGQSAGGRGVVEGWGSVGTGGKLINNGVVIGDGHDHNRALDLSGFSGVESTVPPSANGGQGWYVQNGGQIKLPPIAIQAGTHSYTWGDSTTADAPHLVNSLRLTVHDQPNAASLSITLRTIALNDPLAVILPTEMSVISLWQFEGESFDPSKVDVLLRYNDAAANMFYPGEDALELLAHEDGQWQLAGDLTRDDLHHLISGEFDGAFDYLAVGVPWMPNGLSPADDVVRMDLSQPRAASTGAAAAPEPGGLLLCAIWAGSLLRRKRRS